MKVIILEDENRAVNHLKRLIERVAPDMEVSGTFETVRETIAELHSSVFREGVGRARWKDVGARAGAFRAARSAAGDPKS